MAADEFVKCKDLPTAQQTLPDFPSRKNYNGKIRTEKVFSVMESHQETPEFYGVGIPAFGLMNSPLTGNTRIRYLSNLAFPLLPLSLFFWTKPCSLLIPNS
jgi:hypothetical protein